jgi:two-component system, LytTR family, sensor kinase
MLPRLRYAAIAILIASVPVVVMVLGERGSSERGFPPEPVWEAALYGAAQWYPLAILAPFVDGLVRRSRPKTRADRVRVLGRHVALAVTFLLFHSAILNATTGMLWPQESVTLLRRARSDLLLTAILYTAIAIGFTVAESRRRQIEIAARLRAEVAEARLDALRQQLNPHFLFNTLNHIVSELRSLRRQDVEPALRMLLALSDLLRDVLRERAQLIPLRDEVRMVERYLEIERARFGDRLQAEVTFEPRALEALVPSLMLQPLLENAMKHGVSATDGRCRVSLSVRLHAGRIRIEVRDAGPGLDPAKATETPGVGLRNTSERLNYLYGANHTFDLKPLDGGGLLVAIELPNQRS